MEALVPTAYIFPSSSASNCPPTLNDFKTNGNDPPYAGNDTRFSNWNQEMESNLTMKDVKEFLLLCQISIPKNSDGVLFISKIKELNRIWKGNLYLFMENNRKEDNYWKISIQGIIIDICLHVIIINSVYLLKWI